MNFQQLSISEIEKLGENVYFGIYQNFRRASSLPLIAENQYVSFFFFVTVSAG